MAVQAMHWQEVQEQARSSKNGEPTDDERAAVRETYYQHDRELSNPESRRLLEADPPELDEVQRGVLDDLRRDGIAVLPFTDLFGEELWSRLAADSAAFVEQAQVEVQAKVEKQKGPKPGKEMSPEKRAKLQAKMERRKKKFIQARQFQAPGTNKGRAELTADSPWLEFTASPRILDVINTYLGLWTKATYIDEWYTPPSPPERGRFGSERWHRDYNDQHLVKAFLYMVDVDEGTGPFQYVPGSAHGPYSGEWPWEPLGETYPSHEEFVQRVPESEVRTLTAPKGTLILCNTSGFHRGGYATESTRVMGVLNYTSPAALASLVRRNFEIDPDELEADVSESVAFAFSD